MAVQGLWCWGGPVVRLSKWHCIPERGIKYGGEFLFNKFCAKFLCAICSVFLRICTATH